MLLDQGIEKHDAPVAAKAREKSIAFSGALGSIHDEDILQRKIDRVGIAPNGRFKRGIAQWFETVEQGHDPGRGDILHHDHEAHHRGPGINPCP